MLMDIFKNVGAKDKTEIVKKRARMGAAATERTKSNKAEETGIWIKLDEVELAADDLHTTTQVELRHLGNHLFPRDNGNVAGQETVNPDATLGSKTEGPDLIKEDDPKPRRLSRRQRLLSTVEMSGSCPTACQAASRQPPSNILINFAESVLDGETGELLEYRRLIKRQQFKNEWKYLFGNKSGRLAQGIPGRSKGNDTLFFVDRSEVPADRWKHVTYEKKVSAMYDPRRRRPIKQG